MQRRRRTKSHTFDDQIAAPKARLEEQLADGPRGPQRDEPRKKIRQLDTASHISEWLTSPGLRPPD
jgi:hypothetical protein